MDYGYINGYACSSKEEEEFLKGYDASKYPHPSVTADIVIFTVGEGGLSMLLVKRGGFPYKDRWALPGGFLNTGKESLDQAAVRELKEETGVDAAAMQDDGLMLRQVHVFSEPFRDPRTTVISVAYSALVPMSMLKIKAGDDAADARLFRVGIRESKDLGGKYQILLSDPETGLLIPEEDLAFDHGLIIRTALDDLRSRIENGDDALYLLRDRNNFTISELLSIVEAVSGKDLDHPNFRKRFLKRYVETGYIKETGEVLVSRGKPARLYRMAGKDKEE